MIKKHPYEAMKARVLAISVARSSNNPLSPEDQRLETELVRKGLLTHRHQLTELFLQDSPEAHKALLDAFTDAKLDN